MANLCWRLDATKLPQRLDLDIPDELYAELEQLSARSGRSVRDIAQDLICRSIDQAHA